MAKTTTILGLPYPEATDEADVPTDMMNLAEAIDGLFEVVDEWDEESEE